MVATGLFLVGLVLLVIGAEALVRGASRLSLTIGVSPLVVGLTVVAYGTSSPEMAVSVQSAMAGRNDLAVGNVVGSNIFNVLFILGVSALITPLLVARQFVRQEVPIMIGTSLLLFLIAFDGQIGMQDGALLLGLLIAYTIFVIRQSLAQSKSGDIELLEAELGDLHSRWDRHWAVQVVLIVAGLAMLVLGATWLVEAAVTFATYLGVSELVIGLTIVAAGTSLPEVATSILATVRGQRDIAVGNVVGSNIFNILGVLGISALASSNGLHVQSSMLVFDIPIMCAVAVACLPIFFTGHLIARWEGLVFIAAYAAYTTYLVFAVQQHDGLQNFSLAMQYAVLPAVAVTLMIGCWREWQQRRQA
jgi:cation:H+ antiporter